jgi:uncharacterized protein YbjT (DUF2867 family)
MRVLLTGATGYVGRRLLGRLAADPEIGLRVFVRSARKLGPLPDERVEVAEGDTFDRGALGRALGGVDTAYYLIHSLGAGRGFEDLERRSAENFREVCLEQGVGRIIYLGGLGIKETASAHLRSRLETGEILSARSDRIRTLWFRAGIVVGSGSSSFEIVRHLVQKLPVMITPRWVRTRTQPIGIDDVLSYLARGLRLDMPSDLIVDIGAAPMTFREMLSGAARVMGLRRVMLPVPFLTPRLSSYWLILMTPIPYRIGSLLVEGLKSETVAQNDNAARFFPEIKPVSYERAFARALKEIERRQVVSRWCDSEAAAVCDLEGRDKIAEAVVFDRRSRSFAPVSADRVFRSVKAIGGERGWLAFGWMWRLRGFLDKLAGGPGLNRGRRDLQDLRPGDGLDFWRVADLKPGRRLLLSADMKAPGKAWLEFTIEGTTLVQTAYFLPQGIWGRLYWLALKPAHGLIFNKLLRRIIARASREIVDINDIGLDKKQNEQ